LGDTHDIDLWGVCKRRPASRPHKNEIEQDSVPAIGTISFEKADGEQAQPGMRAHGARSRRECLRTNARCPLATDICRRETPRLRPLGGRMVACHHAVA
jgi:hypothetical protein